MKGDGKARFFLLSTTAIRIDGSEVNPCRMRRLLPRPSTAIRVPRGMLFRYLIDSCLMNIWSAGSVFKASSNRIFTASVVGTGCKLLYTFGGSLGGIRSAVGVSASLYS